MDLSNDDASKSFAKRSVLDRHAVKAMGDLLMIGVRIERRLASLDRTGIFRRR